MDRITGLLRKYISDSSGLSAVVFAMTLPALVAAGGLAVDLAKAQNVKNRLGNALDAAALATANSTGEDSELEDRLEKFFKANFPDAKMGTAYGLTLEIDGNELTVSASADVETSFMRIFGKEMVTVSARSVVTRELAGIEVALVLDVTGSMAGSNIQALREASEDFVTIMFDQVSDPEFIRIGVVPYSSSVNVGPFGLGEDESGNSYGSAFVVPKDPDQFISPSSNIEYNPSSYWQWHGCVEARNYPLDTEDTGPFNWEMYRYPAYCTNYGWQWISGQGWTYGCSNWSGNPNANCPDQQIVPLTSDENTLLNAIGNLNAGGHTYGNFGMVWGWRVISPEFPFEEGAAYDDPEWNKAVLMMTDGQNTMHPTYSAYGLTSDHNIDPGDLNDRFAEICTKMKEKDINIYTVTFQSGVPAATREYYRQCASDPSQYYHAPSNAELVDVFQQIANQLSKLHLSQ